MKNNGLKPLAVYVHIPFCEQKCRYCDFLSSKASDEIKLQYLLSLMHEINQTDGSKYIVKSIFIGGGTPSCVPAYFITKIMETLEKRFMIAVDAEISMEMNPGTVCKTSLIEYKKAGINRVSLGLQSTFDDELGKLGRIHDYKIFLNTYGIVRSVGFKNVNIDLMSSLPGQTVDRMQTSLERVTALEPEHISVYSLIVEDGTPFARMAEEGRLNLPDEDTEIEIDKLTRSFLAEKGYRRYEISNYALEDYECRHNLVYWNRGDYLGFGLGAASLIGSTRFSNTRDLKKYIGARGMSEMNIQRLTDKDAMEEFMFLGLRKVDGISENDFEKHFGKSIMDVYGDILNKQVEEGMMHHEGDRWALTEKGLDVSNVLMAEYLF